MTYRIFLRVHLYIHVPFCARRCSYCDFAIAVRRAVPSARYADAVLREWRATMADPRFGPPRPLQTVYLGGGTPSHLAPAELARLLAGVRADREIAPGAEVTLEANPEDVTAAAVEAWREAGINRVSLGVQSFAPAVLTWMHRTHTAEQVPAAVETLRTGGIGNLSLDLIFALPEQLERRWEDDLDRALALEPDHLSLYGLTVEAHTPLGRWVGRGETRAPPDDRYAAEFQEAHTRLERAGYRHYEVSNYARRGREAVHNAAYWRRAPYLGLGPSAHSSDGRARWWNLREFEAWCGAVEARGTATDGSETLSPEAVRLEELYLGLRTLAGVPHSLLPSGLARDWETAGWARVSAGRLVLTAEGWLRLDALVERAAGAGFGP